MKKRKTCLQRAIEHVCTPEKMLEMTELEEEERDAVVESMARDVMIRTWGLFCVHVIVHLTLAAICFGIGLTGLILDVQTIIYIVSQVSGVFVLAAVGDIIANHVSFIVQLIPFVALLTMGIKYVYESYLVHLLVHHFVFKEEWIP